MGGNKITGLAAGTASTDAANLGNIVARTGQYVATVGGTADVITITPSPAITAYAAGQQFSFIASGTNTGAVTVNVNGLGAKAVTKNGATALAAGNITINSIVLIEYDGTQFQLNSVDGGAVTASGLTMTTARLLGRTTGSTGAIEEISVAASLTLSAGSLSGTAASDTQAGVIEVAVQSEMETGTSTTLAVTPGRMQYHPGVAKVWGRFGVSGDLTNGYNISSITDGGAGLGAVSFTTAFSGATTYASQFNVIDNAGSTSITYAMSDAANPPQAGSNNWRSMNYNWTGGQDPTVGYMYVAHGDQ